VRASAPNSSELAGGNQWDALRASHQKVGLLSESLILEPLIGIEPMTYSFTYTSISQKVYMRIRLYIRRVPISRNLASLVSRSGVSREFGIDATVSTKFWSLTVIRETSKNFFLDGQGFCDPPWSCSTS